MNTVKINEEGKEVLKILRSMHNVCWKIYKDLKLHTYSDKDTRQAFFAKSLNCIRNCYLSYEYFYSYLIDDANINDKLYELCGEESKKFILYTAQFEYLQFAKTGMQILLYSSLESSLRSICNELQIGSPTKKFSEQYRKLIEELGLDKKYIELLDILGLIRNTVHNNGVYISPNGKDKKLSYNGVTFEFTQFKAIDCVTINNLNHLYRGVFRLFKEIINHNTIKEKHLIKEYYSDGYEDIITSLNPEIRFK